MPDILVDMDPLEQLAQHLVFWNGLERRKLKKHGKSCQRIMDLFSTHLMSKSALKSLECLIRPF